MVRASATGAFNYAKADPYNPQWRLRHIMILRDVARQDNLRLLEALHAHWLAYVSHSHLEENSWKDVKNHATDMLIRLRETCFPWEEPEKKEGEKDTIDSEYGDLIAQYRRMVASKKAPDAADEGQQ